ncbi:hypothetical protein CCR80_03140 [Rhodothalassium salexigens]|nr:hypothetical protein [Rhodothalassium salexigens]
MDVAATPSQPSGLPVGTTTERIVLACRVGRTMRRPRLSAALRQQLEHVAWLLIRDTDAAVRAALAFELRQAPDVPRALAMRIVKDLEEDVAAPFIASTPLFDDGDWLRMIDDLEDDALTALAHRSAVSDALAEAILRRGSDRAVRSLVSNPGTKLSPDLCRQVVSRFGKCRPVMDGMAERGDLPQPVVEMLLFRVSDRVRARLVEQYAVDETAARKLGLTAHEAALLAYLAGQEEARLPALVQRLALTGKLTDSLIVAAARQRHRVVCLLALAHRASETAVTVRRRLQKADTDAWDHMLARAEIAADKRGALKGYLSAIPSWN